MKGTWIKYTTAELQWIERNRTMTRADLTAAFRAEFGRDDITVDNIKALCTRKRWATGRSGCFEKGFVPANKGKKMPYNANSARTQFKPGQLPKNTKYLGHERVSKDGYVEISVDQVNPHTGFGRRYVLKHRYLWEQKNGPVPKGHVLKSLDGNKLNTDPSNWELIPRAMIPLLQARYGMDYNAAEPELRPAIMAVAKLKHGLNQRKPRRRAQEARS